MDCMTNRNDNTVYRKKINYALLESMNLTDCFRDLYPLLRRYTCHSRSKSSTLDYWFISDNLSNFLIQNAMDSCPCVHYVMDGSDNSNTVQGFLQHTKVHQHGG